MADYDIYANITANTKGYEAGIKKAQESTKKFGTSVSKVIQGLGKSGFVGALGAVGLASAGVTATLGAVVKVVKKVAQSIGECTEAFRTQTKVETALAVSVQNNPLVDGTATTRLKNFASEIQRVSDIGDEQLLPMMSDLIAKGRTESETMQIIKVATDMASTGTISFENAVSQLNATLNGNIGRLGQQNAELKTLTEEELKSGKAVEILGQKYNGLAQATADSNKQLKNAIGDLKENLGAVFEKGLDPMRRYFAEVIGNINQAISSSREFKQAMKDVFEESGEVDLTQTSDKLKTALDATINSYAEATMNYRQYLELYGEYIDEQTDATAIAYRNDIAQLKEQATNLSNELLRRQRESQKQTQARLEAEERAKKEKEINDLKDAYLKKIAEQEARWKNIKDVTGEEVTNEEKIKFYQDSLVDLMTQAGGQITTNNQLYKDQMAIIQKLTEGLEEQKKAFADIASWENKLRQQEIDRISQADKEVVDYGAKRINLEKIFKLNTQQLEAQMQADLKGVEETENAEEAKAKIVEYYNNEKLSLTKDYNEQLADLTAQEEAELWNQQQEQMQKYFKTALSYAEKISGAFKKMATAIGNAIAGVFNKMVGLIKSVLQKVFTSDLDGLLDSLLKFEDSILTFFVETLPKLPAFFESALQSVGVLLESVLKIITPERVAEIITNIMNKITEYAPKIIDMISKTILQLIQGITKALPEIIKTMSTVVKEVAKVLPQLIQSLITAFIEILKNPKEIADMIMALINGFVEIFKVLMKNIGPLLDALLPVIGRLIVEIVRAIPSILGTMASALGEAVVAIGKHIINLLIDVLNNLLKGLSNIWTWIPGSKGLPLIPHLATGTDNAKKGLTLVGEAGPELVNFRGGEQVLNNHNTQKALAGMGGTSNEFNVNFYNTKDTSAYALVSEFKQYNRQMAINGVI